MYGADVRRSGTLEERHRLLARVKPGQQHRGRPTRLAAVKASSGAGTAASTPPMNHWLQGYCTVISLGHGQRQALHAHLVQKCVSLRVHLCCILGLQGSGTVILGQMARQDTRNS